MDVELVDVTKRFGSVRALDGVSLALRSGQRCALIGPNGAGKSTLTRCLMGMLTYAGTIRLDGLSPCDDGERLAHRIAYVPQIAPRLASRVGELLRVIASLRGIDEARIEVTAARLNLDIAGIRRQAFRDLSGGMRQKLLLALALCTSAGLLILDEPTASLDAATRQRFFELIEELPESPTIVLSSHRLEEIRTLVDDVAVLQSGSLAFFGSATEFLERGFASTVEVRVGSARGRQLLTGLGFRCRRGDGWWIRNVANEERVALVQRLATELGPDMLDVMVRDAERLDAEALAVREEAGA
ncbi:MAG: ABC transporter ATP-binding protein [Planctomycetes bacterium]|nr:ABC transporter ATP-binding protein [Planctomycetota bacterium]